VERDKEEARRSEGGHPCVQLSGVWGLRELLGPTMIAVAPYSLGFFEARESHHWWANVPLILSVITLATVRIMTDAAQRNRAHARFLCARWWCGLRGDVSDDTVRRRAALLEKIKACTTRIGITQALIAVRKAAGQTASEDEKWLAIERDFLAILENALKELQGPVVLDAHVPSADRRDGWHRQIAPDKG
jgi:hypothetical protein